jgi:hypothetical protein
MHPHRSFWVQGALGIPGIVAQTRVTRRRCYRWLFTTRVHEPFGRDDPERGQDDPGEPEHGHHHGSSQYSDDPHHYPRVPDPSDSGIPPAAAV